MLSAIIDRINSFFTYTFARFYAGFYCFAAVEIDARM